MKVLVADPISEEGIAIMRPHAQVDVKTGLKADALIAIIGEYDALVVRSQTQVTAAVIQAGEKLQIIGRAGVGVDNIDVEEATRRGRRVVNAPTGNTISAAEHTIAMMLALARHIPQANASLKSCQWKRNDFMGTEVRGKTLGIIGLGNVGSEVARRARALEMKLLGYDPYISEEKARALNVELAPLNKIYTEADFVTLHIPMTAATKNLIGTNEIAMMKPTTRLINTARGGLIDETALAEALKARKLGGAAIDVFPVEPCIDSPLFQFNNVIVTPHLGASTTEAQAGAARDVAEQIVDVFQGKRARYAVNAPFIPPETLPLLIPFINLATTIGSLVSQLAEGQMNNIKIKYNGEISNYDTNTLKAAILAGLLKEVSEEHVNLINASVIAARRGLTVVEQRETNCENYSSLITVEARTSAGTTTVAGTVLRGESHIVKVNSYWTDILPTGGYFLFSDHMDRPGLIGAVGKITGDADINISSMHLSRLKPRGQALMILALDEPLPETHQKQILSLKDVYTAKLVKL